MQPWVVDANHITIEEDIEFFEKNLLLVSPAIGRFLGDQNKTATIVIAPKGFGKTLLLKAKRIRYGSTHPEFIPQNALIDKPSGAPPSLKHTEYESIRSSEAYWESLWLLAITIPILCYRKIEVTAKSPTVRGLLTGDVNKSPCDVFKRLLSVSRGEFFASVEDYSFQIVPAIRQLHSQIAIFIDNVDEFFEFMFDPPEPDITTEIYRDYWHYSQMGLAMAARDINAINNHVKVFVSIRKEVFQKSASTNPMTLQLVGFSVDVRYSENELIRILENNIASESTANLASPNKKHQIERFFGSDNLSIYHAATGDEEKIEHYLIRHTLRRPRDIAFIGSRISNVTPGERTQERLKNEINRAGSDLAKTFAGEMRRRLSDFDSDLIFSLIHSNTLDAAEIEKISKIYDKNYKKKCGIKSKKGMHVFCNLFKIGLLGYVTTDPENGLPVQRFKYPGEADLDAHGILPRAEQYVIHPMLDDIIAQHDAKYYMRMNKMNIIGFDRPWRGARKVYFVAKGDLKGYGAVMRNPDMANAFPSFLKETVDSSCRKIRYSKVEGGDSILLCDESPSDILDAIDGINARIKDHYPGQAMRFGGSAGYIEFTKDEVKGLAILEAARVEPHVPPGRFVVTGEFREAIQSLRLRNLELSPVGSDDVAHLREENRKFNVAKETEEPLWRELLYVARSQPSFLRRMLP